MHRLAGALGAVTAVALIPFLVEEGTRPAGRATIPILVGVTVVSWAYWALTHERSVRRFPALASIPGSGTSLRDDARRVAADELASIMRTGQALHQQAFFGRAGWADIQSWISRTRDFLSTVFGPAEAQIVGGVALVPTENFEQVVGEYVRRLEALVQRLDRVEMRVDSDAIREASRRARGEDTANEESERISGLRLLLPYWRNRQLLARALKIAYREGSSSYGGDAEHAEWAHWEKRTHDLIEAALGEGAANRFVTDWVSPNEPAQTLTGLYARLQHLLELIQTVDSVSTTIQIRSDFDGRDWVSRR
jgi:hypothetical protein